jgi:pyridoxine 5-phosphate synthase
MKRNSMRKKLGVNIDHVATIRQARMTDYPDPLYAGVLAELAGADSITIHLREDRRHIQDRDVYLLKNSVKTRLNLEMTIHPEIMDVVLKVVPDEVCVVPERREEITTEGGLDAAGQLKELKKAIIELHNKKIIVSLFIDPDKAQIKAARDAGADAVEIHTGRFADAKDEKDREKELQTIKEASAYAASLGLVVNAGHGLNYNNVYPIALIPEIETLNIGHSIIGRAIFVGLDRAVRDMIAILDRATDRTS